MERGRRTMDTRYVFKETSCSGSNGIDAASGGSDDVPFCVGVGSRPDW